MDETEALEWLLNLRKRIDETPLIRLNDLPSEILQALDVAIEVLEEIADDEETLS